MSTVSFLDGFVPLGNLPFVHAPMMKPYRIRTDFNPGTNVLSVITERLNTIGDRYQKEVESDDYYPASDADVQADFLDTLSKAFASYNYNLKVCCLRRGSQEPDIGIMDPKSTIIPFSIGSFHILTSQKDGWAEHNGKTVKVLRQLTSDEVDEEVGPMYEIEVPGVNPKRQAIYVFHDELLP